MNNMTINFDVFLSFMKYGIDSNIKSCLVITIKESISGKWNVKIMKKVCQPLEFINSGGDGAILNFRGRTRKRGLLFEFLRDGRVSEK